MARIHNSWREKQKDVHLTPHNVKPGAAAFKKRLRNQYTRREYTRSLQRLTTVWDTSSELKRPESSDRAPQGHRERPVWKLTGTVAQALKDAGIL